MTKSIQKTCRHGTLSVFRKPSTSDPFINSKLTSIGPGADGAERFWISTVNGLCGPSSVLVDENGAFRIYRWPTSMGTSYLYGVAAEATDTLWLAGGGHFLFRVSLEAGDWQRYELSAGRFITSGMVFDRQTKKVFTGMHTEMASFDTEKRSVVRVYHAEDKGPDSFHSDHWRNRDGTYGFLLCTPGLSYLRWFPKEEKIEWMRLADTPAHPALGLVYHHGYVEKGRVYIPHVGWLDGVSGKIHRHDHPPKTEADWFGKRGRYVFGVRTDSVTTTAQFLRWDTRTGEVCTLFSLGDVPGKNCALTRSGKILAMDLRGAFSRHDALTGALELTRMMDIKNPHVGHTVVPADKDTIVGTPFICQNFWILNTRTGKGYEAGRAAGSYGQIDNAVNVGGKVYFSAYGGSQLTEYDPCQPANYPRNPRLVAKSNQGQHGAGITTDGRVIWCAYRPKYGTLDGAMIRYDTETGEATYKDGAIRNEHIVHPMYDPETSQLVAGTSYLSDCATAEPTCDQCYVVTLDPVTMAVTKRASVPTGISQISPVGPLGRRRWLMRVGHTTGILRERPMELAPQDEFQSLPEGCSDIQYAGRPGRFVMQLHDRLLLWDAIADSTSTLATHRAGFVLRCCVHGPSLYCDCGRHVAVLRNVLGGKLR